MLIGSFIKTFTVEHHFYTMTRKQLLLIYLFVTNVASCITLGETKNLRSRTLQIDEGDESKYSSQQIESTTVIDTKDSRAISANDPVITLPNLGVVNISRPFNEGHPQQALEVSKVDLSYIRKTVRSLGEEKLGFSSVIGIVVGLLVGGIFIFVCLAGYYKSKILF